MSYLDRRATSWMSSSFDALDNSRNRVRILVAAAGLVATIIIWVVHLSYPHIFLEAFASDRKIIILTLFVITVAPPFAVVYGLGSIITRRQNSAVHEESGPMSGYFYRERANTEYKVAIIAGILGALNFLLLIITGADSV